MKMHTEHFENADVITFKGYKKFFIRWVMYEDEDMIEKGKYVKYKSKRGMRSKHHGRICRRNYQTFYHFYKTGNTFESGLT